jgi:hypothetical protein
MSNVLQFKRKIQIKERTSLDILFENKVLRNKVKELERELFNRRPTC